MERMLGRSMLGSTARVSKKSRLFEYESRFSEEFWSALKAHLKDTSEHEFEISQNKGSIVKG